MVGLAGCLWRGVFDRLPGVLEIERNVARVRHLVAPLELAVPDFPKGGAAVGDGHELR